MARFAIAGIIAALVAAAAVPAALTGRTACRGVLGAVLVDTLVVPEGARCTLLKTRISGTLTIEAGSTLDAVRVRIVGNIKANRAGRVTLGEGSSIIGSVEIISGGSARILSSAIHGSLRLDGNRGTVVVTESTITGSLQALRTTGGVAIIQNEIYGNLQCRANTPPPTGGRNSVRGNKEGQCARL